jgi:excisionase family DNA binding protein
MATSNTRITKYCERCGSEFQAQRVTTRFCSHRCAELANKAAKRQEQIAQTEQQVRNYLREKSVEDIKHAELLSLRDAAKLFGVTRQTVYNMVQSGTLKAYRITSRLSRIRRKDIDDMLDANVYPERCKAADAVLTKEANNEITEFYTTKEVIEKFGISNTWLFKIAKQKKIPKTLFRGKSMWSKSHCDKIFGKGKIDGGEQEITQWYSAAEMCEKFGMTTSQVYNLVNRHNIPKKKEGNTTSYSKKHVNIAKGIDTPDETRWYSYAEAMERYQLSHDQVGHYIRWHKLNTRKSGKYVYFDADAFDKLLAPPKI